MLKVKDSDKYIVPIPADFPEQSIVLFEKRHAAVFRTVHVRSSRRYGADGAFLFSKRMSYQAEYCVWKRYSYRKHDKACLRDCAAGVEQECLRAGLPFRHTCRKGVTELVVPFVWDGVLELIFYAGRFRMSGRKEEELIPESFFRSDLCTVIICFHQKNRRCTEASLHFSSFASDSCARHHTFNLIWG